MEISFIWFDLGYTLVYRRREEIYQKVLEEIGIKRSLHEIEKAYHLTDKLFMREYPGILGKEPAAFMPWYLGVLNYYLNLRVNLYEVSYRIDQCEKNFPQKWIAFDHVHHVLRELKGRSFRLGIISNWDHTARKVIEANGLAPYFEQIIISAEVGYEKPDPQIFQLAMEKAGVTAEECLYIGDNYYDDVMGCNQVGMESFLINRFGSLGIEEIDHHTIIKDISEILPVLKKGKRVMGA